uniref:hypothetical protein n=1 Tax=Roseovarius sp. TaxID=1486281 RepID=UPI003568DCAC
MSGVAPVATGFVVGTLEAGDSLTASATDIVAAFGSDADSILSAGDVTFTGASVDGSIAALSDVGFSYLPGGGVSGDFSIDTGAPAFAGVSASASIAVEVTYSITDGTSTTAGTLTFAVAADADGMATATTLAYLGPTILGQDLSVEAIAAPGARTQDIAVSGETTLEDALVLVNSSPGASGLPEGLTIATAKAENESV